MTIYIYIYILKKVYLGSIFPLKEVWLNEIDFLWIELPWPKNPVNTYVQDTEKLDSCLDFIESHQQRIPWSPPIISLKQLSSFTACHAQVFAEFSGHGTSIHNIIPLLIKKNGILVILNLKNIFSKHKIIKNLQNFPNFTALPKEMEMVSSCLKHMDCVLSAFMYRPVPFIACCLLQSVQ